MGYKTHRIGITWTDGNEKLGNVLVVNRPVGLTCPISCPLLDRACYALATEKRFPMARIVARENLVISADSLIKALRAGQAKGHKAARIHERGDFGQQNRIDRPYVKAWRKALQTVRELTVWGYTHFYNRAL